MKIRVCCLNLISPLPIWGALSAQEVNLVIFSAIKTFDLIGFGLTFVFLTFSLEELQGKIKFSD